MSDPTRLLHEESDADALERALLESLHHVGPSERDKAAAWQGLSAGLVAAGVVGASTAASAGAAASAMGGASAKLTTAGATASALSKAWLVKVAVLVTLSGATTSGVLLYRERTRDPKAAPTAAQPAHEEVARPAGIGAPSVADTLSDEADTQPVTQPEPQRRARAKAPAPRAEDTLAQESALLREARAALRSGDLTAAEATLTRLTRAFPRGVLAQESDVLAIELLVARDQNAAARARAARFVAQHPESPHSAKLERLLQ